MQKNRTHEKMAASSSSLTTHLLSLSPRAYEAATQSPFLQAAGQGRLDKKTLGTWLANDRLYIHAYIKAVGRVLATIDLPQTTRLTPTANKKEQEKKQAPETQLVDWLFATLTALRREERLFVDVARRYGLDVDLATEAMAEGGREVRRVPGTVKLTGLVMFERLFGSLHPAASVDRTRPVPWLEAAVVFWGTERVYCDAWRWARSHQKGEGDGDGDGAEDADGGALRRELVPNWANDEFKGFVEQLAQVVDGAVDEAVEEVGGGVRKSLVERAEKVWRELVDAEAAFWPVVE